MKYFLLITGLVISFIASAEVKHIARFEYNQSISYGEMKGEFIQPLSGNLLTQLTPTGKPIALEDVTLL